MMKLLLIYCMVVFFCLPANSENRQLQEPEVKEQVNSCEPQVTSVSSERCICPDNWLRTYFLMFNALNPVKQLDMPSDQDKNWAGFPYKVLHFVRGTMVTVPHCISGMNGYSHFLSARYLHGFYIYTLRKLLL